jgi:hypothetical protein
MTTEPAQTAKTAPARAPKPPKYKVRKYVAGMDTHPVLFSDESQALAENFIRKNHPRGKEVYLEHPDGTRRHYSADHDNQGTDAWFDWEDDEED